MGALEDVGVFPISSEVSFIQILALITSSDVETADTLNQGCNSGNNQTYMRGCDQAPNQGYNNGNQQQHHGQMQRPSCPSGAGLNMSYTSNSKCESNEGFTFSDSNQHY